MKKTFKKMCVVAVLLISVFSLSGCGLLSREKAVLAPPLVEPEQVNYKTEPVVRQDMEKSITVTGYFVTAIKQNHYFRYLGGRIKKIHVRYNDMVKQGDLLAELLTDNIETDIKYQQIDVDSKVKALEFYKQTSEMDLEAAREELAKAEKKRAAMLETPGIYSAEDIRNIEDDIKVKKANLQKLELTIQNQLDIKNKDLEIARLKLQSLMNQLEKSRLYAQMDGQVVHIANVGEGNSIDAYTTVVTLADVNELEIEYVGREAGNFRNGMKVELTVKKETFSGEVIRVPADVPFEEYERYRETVRFRVVGRMPEGVKPGDNVTIKLTLEQKLNTLTVPRSAVRMYMGNKLVYVLEDGLRIEKQVETGIEQGNMTEILEGLEEGELVIIN